MIAALPLALALQAAQAPASPPVPEAEALGVRLSQSGTLAGLLPLLSAKETAELLAAHPELGAADRAELAATAKTVAAQATARLMAAEGHAYAARLSLPDLRTLVAFAESPAARRQRAAQPAVIAATMQSVGGFDFKHETLAAFCAKTGKACPAQ